MGTLVLALESPSDKEPVSLQFDFVYPSPQAAGKRLICAGRPEDAGTYVQDKRFSQIDFAWDGGESASPAANYVGSATFYRTSFE